jgi:EAL domain-containing protein (putative c-di-GMP-specific phosphodiesterase class I)
VKIDRSFVFDIAENEKSRQIIRYISAVATALGVAVIAEGVETQEQEVVLRDLGCCALVQGYRYSAPVRSSNFEVLLETQDEAMRLRAG